MSRPPFKRGDIVKFINPESGEENMEFDVLRVNNQTKRVHIRWRTTSASGRMLLLPIEVVGFNHVEKV
jgi:hypothetical protein